MDGDLRASGKKDLACATVPPLLSYPMSLAATAAPAARQMHAAVHHHR